MLLNKALRKTAAAAAALLTLTFGLCTGGSAYCAGSGIDKTGRTAYLDYDPSTGDITLSDSSGKRLEGVYTDSYSVEADEEQPAVTTSVTNAPLKTTETRVAAVTSVTLRKASPAKTVPAYAARRRSEALSERVSFLEAYTTTTTTTTTTTPAPKSSYWGMDISRYQGEIDWKKVKNDGIEFVIIRAGYGREYDQVDMRFHENIRGAQAAGIPCGVYWYSYAMSTNEALVEARVCCDTIKGYRLEYPVAFDIEDPTQKTLTQTQLSDIIKTFCTYVEEQGYYASVYSYASMINEQMNSSVKSRFDIWVAHTGVDRPNYSGDYGMWQYTWEGRVAGIDTDVDLDIAYRNYPKIIKENHLCGY